MSKKMSFLRVFSKITISVCAFCAFFISPVFATLPAGYTELEYIESTGTQYIDTGVICSDETFGFKVDFAPMESLVVEHGVLGSSLGNKHNVLQIHSTAGGVGLYMPGTTLKASAGITINKKQSWIVNYYNDKKVIIDNVDTHKTTQSISTGLPFALFGRNYGGFKLDYRSKIKLYSCKFTQNANLVREMIPARRNSDGEIGMYDTVSNTFFTNQGTGDFIAGPIAHCKTFGTDGATCTECEADYILNNDGGCSEKIKIATTKMVDDEFAAAEAKLATTVQTIESVVSRTITQTGQIATLHETKQTRPDESCPANTKCLLVQDEDGTPHWYPIIEP